ncbi:hypothetical protein BG005_002083, partial [Podila minutissima]
MSALSQKFKFGPTEKELGVASSNDPHEPLFIYVDDVLEAFKIPDADRFEADGRTVAYLQDGNGTIIPCRPGCVIQVVYEIPQFDTTSYELRMQEEVARIQDQLFPIQSKTKAILAQRLELLGPLIPRLFIVLPEEPAKYNPGNWFRTKFRLHFICECGKHTEPSNCKVPHHLHLAKHEGYLIREPTEFFQKYGPFLLLMLELIKVGTNVAGHVVPTLASLKVVELADSVKQSVELVTAKIDLSLESIDKQLTKVQASSPGDFTGTEPRAETMQQNLANYSSGVEGLEGVDLRQLRSFLTISEEEDFLGNLYRMMTSDGGVKWVCLDHYRASYQKTQTQKLRDVVQLARGEFDEQRGRITVTLKSSLATTEFCNAVSTAKSVLGLNVDFGRECTRKDLKTLEKALKDSRVSVLRLDLRQLRLSLKDKLFLTPAYCKSLFRIMENPNMKLAHVILPEDHIKISEFPPKTPSYFHKLSFGIVSGSTGAKDFGLLSEIIKINSALTTLDLRTNSIGDSGAQALSEALKTNSTLISLYLYYNSIGDNGAQALAEALKINSNLTTLNLDSNSIGDNGAQALAEALKTNATLTTLSLESNSVWFKGLLSFSEATKSNSTLTILHLTSNVISDNIALTLSDALKTNSALTALDLQGDLIGDNGAQALADALKTDSSLTTLHLGTNSIGDNGAQALAEALKTNSTLVTLDLWRNSIGDPGAQVLSEALKINSTLTTLDLWSNSISDKGAQALAEALKTNSTLATLYLGANSIGDNGAQALAESLKTDFTLVTLDLWRSSIGDSGVQALSEALKTNSTLTTLDLAGNSIGDNGAQALSEALKTNSTLITLNLERNSIGDNGARLLHQASQTLMQASLLSIEHIMAATLASSSASLLIDNWST